MEFLFKSEKMNWSKENIFISLFSAVTISSLLETILSVLDDSSSVAVRLALSALQLCIHDLLLSVNSDIGLMALLKLLEIRENPYWLVKVGLLFSVLLIFFASMFFINSVTSTFKNSST